jgi:hypothetical protein
MIRLIDLLKAQGIELGNYKIHLATRGGLSQPLDAYLRGEFKEWQEGQNAKNFECDTVLGLIDFEKDLWLFAGAYRILGVKEGEPKYRYATERIGGQDDLIGRVYISFKRNFRSSYIWGKKYGSQLEVARIEELKYGGDKFCGYNEVCLAHERLRMIIDHSDKSWRSALSAVGGVYHIMDQKTGRAYVGSAYGEGGIWKRWSAYAKNSHGGNAELRKLLEKQGNEYALRHFQYSILEIADLSDSKDQVLKRENHWKNVLRTREFGYNSN